MKHIIAYALWTTTTTKTVCPVSRRCERLSCVRRSFVALSSYESLAVKVQLSALTTLAKRASWLNFLFSLSYWPDYTFECSTHSLSVSESNRNGNSNNKQPDWLASQSLQSAETRLDSAVNRSSSMAAALPKTFGRGDPQFHSLLFVGDEVTIKLIYIRAKFEKKSLAAKFSLLWLLLWKNSK